MLRTLRYATLAALVLGTGLAMERSAEACGGCFVPPENNSVVTDHRMILSVGQGKSTLYDQIRYQGSPQSFAWVLPITGEAEVGLSADIVFSALDQLTQVGVVAPPRNCPPPPSCDQSSRNAPSASAGGDFADAGSTGVTVTKQEVVGPYETVQLQATNPAALNDWLTANGFALPDDVKPVVSAYVAEHFNFLAMKLKPGATVQSMRPVRVTTTGSNVVLPLRMVAAGTGAVVGISLWVMGQGRYEPTNFPTFTIKDTDLAWDWVGNQSNYKTLRAERTTASNGRAWELESSIGIPADQIDNIVRYGGGFRPGPGGGQPEAASDYAPIDPVDGKPGKTADQVRDEDLGILVGRTGLGTTLRTTRMRADLAHAALNEDLVVAASTDQSQIGTTRQVTRELNEPICPVFQGCEVVGQAPRSEAASQMGVSPDGSSIGGACSTSNGNTSSGTVMMAGLGVLGLALVRFRKSRKQA